MTDRVSRADLVVLIPCSKRKQARGTWPARDLYRGRQFQAMVAAVDRFRGNRPALTVDVAIVSAGHGVVGEHELMQPYEAELGSNRASWVLKGTALGLPQRVATRIARARHAVVCLSKAYLVAAGLPGSAPAGHSIVYLCGRELAGRIGPGFVDAGRDEAHRRGMSPRDVRAAVLTDLLNEIEAHGLESVVAIVRNEPARNEAVLT